MEGIIEVSDGGVAVGGSGLFVCARQQRLRASLCAYTKWWPRVGVRTVCTSEPWRGIGATVCVEGGW